ncbi:bifunctional DNA primase/polymerase [uncultured Halomonas sp.]|uniref:bifunctional DNA primase/polymerase n=1 Tax=uncultured Halomonas sp. TaxID=173971 RepID=UPI002632F334|nr:bifunctional DNA primase/polymerase [uncultured Halomonas sp.]
MMIYNDFIEADIRIFPLWPIEGGACTCGDEECHAAGKHPRASNWQHSPEWSEDQIEAMEESGQFATGYGVVVAGLLVVDVDERNGGADSYAKLGEDFPEIAAAGLVVRTGSGGASRHLYFKLPEDAALVQNLPQYPGIDFKSSGFVVGPGSLHASGNTYDVLHGDPSDIDEAPSRLVDALRKPDRHRASVNGNMVDVSLADLADMLDAIPNAPDTDYEKWIRIGMALHLVTSGAQEGYDLWEAWSAKGDKHNGKDMPKKWHSFGKSANPVTFGTLAHYAEEEGWVAPVEFTSEIHWEDAPPEEAPPLDADGVDLLRPPGFVGKLAAWINKRNRHPREHLAVAAALSTVSSVAGMRYVDPLDGITPNLFLFGVSGSATGKESILKSYQELLRAAGVSAAVHGGLKSEQEIYRNLVRHQAAIYAIDELGETLSKVMSARKRGGVAPYLEGMIGALLSLYSKANSHALITGDLKEEIEKALRAELSGLAKAMDGGAATEKQEIRHANLVRQIDGIDHGLEAPYLCLFGLTTPERFDALMDADMAANGFMGRSLIFRELEDNPRAKPRHDYRKEAVPDSLAGALQNLYSPGYSETPDRVEQIGPKTEIPTRKDAEAMLDEVESAFWQMAERVKEHSNLTPIPRRGYEQVAKISMVLAIPEGLRTVEHVKWAYALVMRDVEEKMKLAQSNDELDKQGALVGRILSTVTKEHGETLGRIRNKCRAYRKEDVDEAVERLVAAGHLRKEDHRPERGRPTTKFFAR